MIEFESIILNNSQFKELCREEINSNAFLFETTDKVFLTNFSYCFAKFLLCERENKPCGICESCKKVSLLSHSDLIIYPQTHKNILVEDIKNLIDNIYLAPLESNKKVFILNNFSSSTIQAQNKLLKILEEPPKNTYIILNVTNTNKILPTVLSRCKKIRLVPLSDNEISLAISNFDNKNKIIEIASGNLTNAISYSSDKNFMKIYNNCLKTLQEMSDSKLLIKYSSMLLEKKEDINIILIIFESFFRDILLIRLKKEELTKNKEILNYLKEISSEYTSSSVDLIIKKIYDIEKQLEYNCNATFLVDNLLLYILEVKYLCKKE